MFILYKKVNIYKTQSELATGSTWMHLSSCHPNEEGKYQRSQRRKGDQESARPKQNEPADII